MKNPRSTIFLTQVAAFLTACSSNGSFMGLTGSKNKSSNPTVTSPIAQGDTAIADSINQMIVPADPESREEFVELMEALGDEEKRAKLAQIHTDQPSGLTELAIALDDPQFIDYVADFNDHYGRVESRSENARTQLFQVGREMADYLESNYPMAVEMLVDYAERFPPDDITMSEIQKARQTIFFDSDAGDIIGGATTAGQDDSLGFRLQDSSDPSVAAVAVSVAGSSPQDPTIASVVVTAAGAPPTIGQVDVVAVVHVAAVSEVAVAVVVTGT